jgi:hypothetical protein
MPCPYRHGAWTNNGTLHVSGLTPGRSWSIYSISGTLLYKNIATVDKVEVVLPERGVYIVTCGSFVVKVVN